MITHLSVSELHVAMWAPHLAVASTGVDNTLTEFSVSDMGTGVEFRSQYLRGTLKTVGERVRVRSDLKDVAQWPRVRYLHCAWRTSGYVTRSESNWNRRDCETKQDRQCTHKRNINARSRNQCCRGKAIDIEYSECVSAALGIQPAKLIHLIFLSSVACLDPAYFSTFSHKRRHFREKLFNVKCVFWFCIQLFFSEAFLILRTNERDMIEFVYWSSYKLPFILVRF